MRILITGGAGYKGVVLAGRLLHDGHHVTILDNFAYGFSSILHLIEDPRLAVVKEDIRNLTQASVKAYDVIYHLAALSGYPACEANPHSAQLINVDASHRLGELLSENQTLIYASTTSFYGSTGRMCDENTPVEPISLYGITKYRAEQILMQRSNTISLRFATVFGISPRMRLDLMVNDFTLKAVNDRCIVLFESSAKRTFVHVQDAVKAYAFALPNLAKMNGQIYNVGHDTLNYSKREIAEHIKSATDCTIIDSQMTDIDPRHFLVSFDKLARLGYKPTRTLDQGISELLKLYRFYKPFATYVTI